MITILIILVAAICVALYYIINSRQKKEAYHDFNEPELCPKPRVIIVNDIDDMEELKGIVEAEIDCDKETYGDYQFKAEGRTAKITLQGNVGIEDLVDLLTQINPDKDETSADRIKCMYPIGKITFNDTVIADTDAVIYPVGNPDDFIVNICTRDNKVYQYKYGGGIKELPQQ